MKTVITIGTCLERHALLRDLANERTLLAPVSMNLYLYRASMQPVVDAYQAALKALLQKHNLEVVPKENGRAFSVQVVGAAALPPEEQAANAEKWKAQLEAYMKEHNMLLESEASFTPPPLPKMPQSLVADSKLPMVFWEHFSQLFE